MCCINVHFLTAAATTITSQKKYVVAASTSSSGGCPKCGTTQKFATNSCCARGGAWFKNCGDIGDENFDHTWAEGAQACKDFDSSVSLESPRQVMLNHVREIAHSLNAINDTRSARVTQYQRISNRHYGMSNRHYGFSSTGVTDSTGYGPAATFVVCVIIQYFVCYVVL